MTCKRACHSHTFRVFASVVAVFAFVVGLGTPDAIASTPLFLPVVTYDSGGREANMVAVADLNGDGKPDLVVANCGSCSIFNDGSVGVLLGNGDGTFQPAVTYSSGGVTPLFVAVADVNGDGKPDLVVANRCGNNGCLNESLVGVLLGNGDGTFQTAVTYGSGGLFAHSVAVADVNGDGKPDVLVGNDCADSNCDGSVGVLLGNGDGSFQAAVTYLSGGNGALSIAVADVNKDGRPDLLVAVDVLVCLPPSCFGHGAVAVLLGNGDGSFQPPVTHLSGPAPGGAVSVAVADLNGDGNLDLVVENDGGTTASGVAGVLLGRNDGSYRPLLAYTFIGGGHGTSAAVADVDGDRKLDLVATNEAAGNNANNHGMVGVFLGNGDGTFQAVVPYDSGGFLTNWVAVADVNGDGELDLVVANKCADNAFLCQIASVGVLLNNSHPTDTTPPVITLSATPKILWPPNGRLAPVTISGTINDTGSGVNISTAEYAVQDEYGEVQPFGKIALDSAGNYSFTILLRAGRRGNDLNGRQYTLRVSAKDNAGNRGVQWAQVTVPHDR